MRNYRNFESQTIAAFQKRKERDYWINKLSGEIVKTTFPYDHKKTFLDETKKEIIKFKFPGEISSRLLKISRVSSPNLYTIITTGVVLLLKKYTGNKDITIGTPVLKQDIEADFINTMLVLRNPVADDMTFKEFLLQVRQTIAEAAENQNYPIESLVYKLGLEFNETEFPLFDVAVLLKNIQDKSYLHPIKPNIIFSFLKKDQSIEGELEYNALLYENATLRGVIGHLKNLLQVVIFNPAVEIANIEILSGKEKKRILMDFNNNDADFPTDKTINHFIEKHAWVNPDSISISYNEEALSYGELNNQINRLARVLKDKGIQRGQLAGIFLDRSPTMAACILAIWKAGGTYVPIDPDSPVERVRYMLDDCQIPVLLTKFKNIEKFFFTALQGFQNKTVNIHKTALRQQITSFDNVPFPDRSRIDYEKYNQYIGQALVKNSITLQTTRGCPYNCAYCHKIWPKKHVSRSAENIFEELLLYYKMGVKRFVIIDDIFNYDYKNSARFFELIIENDLKVQLFFPNGLRGDILTKKYIDLMVQAGTINIALALETASPRLQKLIGKNMNLEKLRENIEYLCKKYPHVILELFTMIGFPTETEEEAIKTMNFLKSLKWIHFPYIEVLKIFPNTDIEKLAIKNGIPEKHILASENLAFHEFSETIPFDKDFILKYKSDYLNEYFLSRERLKDVLPYQMKVLTEDELIQKYDSYLDVEINSFFDLLQFVGIAENELNLRDFLDDDCVSLPGLNKKLQEYFPKKVPESDALNVLLLDLSLYFSAETNRNLYDVVEPPLGLLYLMSYLDQLFGNKINGRVVKSRIDFDCYEELKALLEQFRPDVIGIRTLSFFKDFFHTTIAMIRQWGINVPIITGGPYATSAYDRILQDKNVDVVVIGEGEVTFAELVERIMKNNKKLPNEEILRKIAGIALTPEKIDTEKKYAREILLLDQLENMFPEEPGENSWPVNDMTDIAYVIYTSGSMGNPKGVMVEHLGMMNHIQAKIDDLQLTGKSIIAQNASQCFDISVWQFFTALVLGGKTIIYPNQLILEPGRFLTRLLQDQVTILEVVPSYLSVLLSILDLDFKELNCLNYLLVTGETLKPGLVREWFENYPEIKMVNAYGPTEAADDITHYIMAKMPGTGQIPIGKPLQNLNIYIVDNSMQLCPVGVKGEICVSGVGVGRGYLNNPGLTAEKFEENPLILASPHSTHFLASGTNNQWSISNRVFRTGDLGCWLPDGDIVFFGRKDYQVKIRGYRIELEEIEKKLADYAGIIEAVVIEKEVGARDEFTTGSTRCLCAFLRADEKLNLQKVKAYLEKILPGYMIPGYFEQIEQMPVTPNGKVDRKALAKLEISVQVQDGEFATAGNEVEKKLVEIWSEVLRIEKDAIGIDSNFFHLGGHSIRATLLVAKIRKEFNTSIQLKDIFELPTIRKFSKFVQEAAKEKFTPIEALEKKEYYPLSSPQKRLFFIQQMEPEGIAYNLPAVYIYEGKLKKDRFEETFRQLIERHKNFRTSFQLVEGEPVQWIHEEVKFEIEYFEVLSNEIDTRKKQEIEKITESFIRPFDLSGPPLLRVGLIDTGDGNWILIIDVHHIITDYISYHILVRDFSGLYAGKQLPPIRLHYKDYAVFQNSENQSKKIKKQEEYWLKEFEGEIPALHLPSDFTRPEIFNYEGSKVYFDIDRELIVKIKRLMPETDTTLFMLLLAVFNILLSKYTGQEDIIVGAPISGRNHTDLQHIIGMFINMLPLRNYPGRDKTFGKFLKEVKEKLVNAYDNENYQFDELVGKLGLKGNLSRNKLLDVVFQILNYKDIEIESGDLGINPYDFESGQTQFDLILEAIEGNSKINMSLRYSTLLFKESTIERMADHYVEILEQIVKDINIKLENIVVSHRLLAGKSNLTCEESTGFEF